MTMRDDDDHNKRGPSPAAAFVIAPAPDAPELTRTMRGVDHDGRAVEIRVVEERPLTIYLNGQEIVTAMTIGDHPDLLALGYLRNQAMLRDDDVVVAVEHDPDLEVVVVRTERETDYEDKLKRRIRTSGCAVGTVYGDVMESLEAASLPAAPVSLADLYALAKAINTRPSLYLAAGAIHGAAYCLGAAPIVYFEDVGRHNAVDKIAGWMRRESASGERALLYTTGRLTSEIVVKTALMGIPALASRSGFTASGVDMARRVGLTLIGRLRGRRFVCLSGAERLAWDASQADESEEPAAWRRKGASDDG